MNARWPYLLFGGGLLLGVVVGFAMGSARKGNGEENGGERAFGRERVVHGSPGSASRETAGRRGKGGRKVGFASRAKRVEEIYDYLAMLSEVDDIEEVNLMELLRWGSLVTNLTEKEVTGLIGTLFEREEEDDNEMMEVFSALLFIRMAELNGPEAMRMVLGGELGEDGDQFIPSGIAAWVEADPKGAERWFLSSGKGAELFEDNNVQQAFFAAMARTDSERARELLLGGEGEISEDGAEAVARYEKSPEGLLELLAGTSGESREEVFEVVVLRDADMARDWLAGQPDLEDRENYVQTLALELMDEDLEEGVAWYMEQELDDTMQSIRYSNIVEQMVYDDDPERASEWLAQQPDSPVRDQAEKDLADKLLWNRADYAGALRWTNELPAGHERREMVKEVFDRGWRNGNGTMPEELTEAARESGFGEELDAYVARRSERDD